MNIKGRLTPPELSLKLKENGYPQESEETAFWWWYDNHEWNLFYFPELTSDIVRKNIVAAPLASEGLDKLPILIFYQNYACCLEIGKAEKYSIRYSSLKKETPHFDSENFSVAVHEMWLFLRENKII